MWTAVQLALFILEVDYEHYLDTPLEIKKRFGLKISIEKIEKLMKSKEYDEVVLRWYLQYAQSKERVKQQFFLIKERYFRQQMKTNVSGKAFEHFGVMSNEYVPKSGTQINNLINLTPEQNEQLGRAVDMAEANRLKRLAEEKKNKEGNGGK